MVDPPVLYGRVSVWFLGWVDPPVLYGRVSV